MLDYKSVSLASQVFDAIEKRILDGNYPPGSILSESKLSEELGVSRTPIREALSRLEAEKLVSTTPGGSVVLGVTANDIEDMFLVKKSLEPITFKKAAANISDEALAKLKENIEQQEFYASKKDYETLRNLDTDFHDLIYQESGSLILFSVLSPVHRKLMKFRKNSLQKTDRTQYSIAEHKGIFEALCERDGDKVAKLMMEHVTNAHDNLVKGEK